MLNRLNLDPSMLERARGVVRRFAVTAPILIVALAAWYLYQVSRQNFNDDVGRLLGEFPDERIWASVVATALSFALLTLNEWLGFRSAGVRPSASRVLKVSVTAFGISNVLSFGGITGTSLRLRLYLKNSISTENILRVTAFSSAGVWIGFMLVAGVCAVIEPPPRTPIFNLDPSYVRALGALAMAFVFVYLALAYFRKPSVRIRGRVVSPPEFKFAFAQTLLTGIDWILAAIALFVLLPDVPGVDFGRFLSVFLLAQVLGAVVTVPGGLGILEVLTVYLLIPEGEISPPIAAGLILYRCVYYVAPLALALLILAIEELVESSYRAAIVFRGVLKVSVGSVPLALAVGLGAAALWLCGASVGPWRAPAAVGAHAISTFAASIAGSGLFAIADGVRRRSLAAWMLSLALVVSATVWSTLGHRPFAIVVAGALLATALVFCRSEFFRRSRLLDVLQSKSGFAAFALATLFFNGILALGLRDRDLAAQPWWSQLTLGPAGTWTGLGVGLGIAAGVWSLWYLLRPSRVVSWRLPYMPITPAQAGQVARQSPITQSQLVLLGDKQLFASQSGQSFLMYAIEGRSWVTLGDPVGPAPEAKRLVADFHDFVDRQGGTAVFYQVHPSNLRYYVDLGYHLIKIGEEARIDLAAFNLEGRERKSLRNTLRRVEKSSVRFEVIPRAELPAVMSRLRAISDEWLGADKRKEKGFSLGFFSESYLGEFDCAVIRQGDEIIAFANLWQSESKDELSVDLMRTGSGCPSGSMDYLFLEIMRWGAERGFRWFNLGMAPLAGLDENVAEQRLWNQLGALFYTVGEHYYNFAGVRAFKEKFGPEWEPRYIAYPNSFSLPLALADLTRLIARGGPKASRRSA